MAITRGYDVGLPANALTLSGDLWSGSGIPGTRDFYTSTNTQDGILFGMSVAHRQGAGYEEVSQSADKIVFDVQAGTQIGNAARAEWGVHVVVDQLQSRDIDNATPRDIHLLIDVNPAALVGGNGGQATGIGNINNYLDFLLIKTGGGDPGNGGGGPVHYVWYNQEHNIFIGDNGEDPGPVVNSTANTLNIGFDFIQNLIDQYAIENTGQPYNYGRGQFDFVLAETQAGVGVGEAPPVMALHMQVNVPDLPIIA